MTGHRGHLAPGPGQCCRGFTASLCLHDSARRAVSLSRTYCCPEHAPGLDSAGQPLGRLESQRIGLGGAWGCPPCCTTKACGICVHTYLCMHVHTHTYTRVRYAVASCGLREEERIRVRQRPAEGTSSVLPLAPERGGRGLPGSPGSAPASASSSRGQLRAQPLLATSSHSHTNPRKLQVLLGGHC